MDTYYSRAERVEAAQRQWELHNARKWAAIWLLLMTYEGGVK